ncbi:2'-5'-oligoadenylate synthase 3-like [Rhinatrema bivittatum]|uniref:2'-5'-oligoadenylate synthase 3-like n=1 Tax=Rhinatrema bivittatum TaxID=194408 RepID=UPI00112C20A1|nr:2'-5'-oligoadenylate synthase 3-like [Rhinatrema bivittatum]
MSMVKFYSCGRCGDDFASPSALRYHFRAKHLGKIYCDKCGSEVSRNNLKQHEKVDHGAATAKTKHFWWNNPSRRETCFVALEICVTCRMCHRPFGTIHSREQHEKQDHHFTASKRAQMSTEFSPESIVEYRSPKQLQEFVETKLRPIPGLLRISCMAETDAVIDLIKECFPLPVTRLIKGGSYIKGIDAQDWSDIDILLFSDAFASTEDCRERLTQALDEMAGRLKKSSWANRILMEKNTPFSVRFQFKCYKDLHSHSFDIMPCYDALGPVPSEGLKRHLFHTLNHCRNRDHLQLYSMSLLQYQVEFVKSCTVGVKDLIRLVKHWLRTSFAKSTKENKFRRLPSSYALELISIYVWQLAGKPIFFSLLQGLRAVLKLLVRYSEICIVWYDHYGPNFQTFKKASHSQRRPFILDPANPIFNVCENSNAWDEVAHVAKQSLLKPLFNGVPAKEPWLYTNIWSDMQHQDADKPPRHNPQ